MHSPCLEQFDHDLRREYGRHAVVAPAERLGSARLEVRTFGAFRVGVATGRYMSFARTRPALDDAWHDCIFLVQQTSGRSRVVHYGREARLGQGDIVLVDSQGPCSFDFSHGPSQTLSLHIPRSSLSNSSRVIRDSARWLISGQSGIGRALSALLASIGATPMGFDGQDRDLMGQTIIAFVRRSIEGTAAVAECDPALWTQITMWARENVSNPDVTPETLANEFHISRRSLYRLFETRAMTPAAWIWDVRLAVARDRLCAGTTSVTDVAFSVGFRDLGHFSRAFKRRYGQLPREVRFPPASHGSRHATDSTAGIEAAREHESKSGE